MKKVLIIILSLLIFSCTEKEKYIYYTYNNTTITRINKENEADFYYGRFESINSLPKSYIKATYDGFDGVMDAFLIIEKDNSAKIVPIADSFIEINDNDKLTLKRFDYNIDFINWEKNIRKKYKNIYRLSNIVELETKRNKEHKSDVKALYPKI
ncbi:hypothetical protein OX284_012175 [Flavobacterium sp. SUN046]|uniref:hypothetical protein n=1 Tax=Flavobacterium sp. SUN046 TaxID=3002440 RepID=UPI002DB71097|nr:hypothetical protein [Flavobacterium sp. SUN046]MEC4050190.1 hypothetical protein [Flavobacterium sp. SUN046]